MKSTFQFTPGVANPHATLMSHLDGRAEFYRKKNQGYNVPKEFKKQIDIVDADPSESIIFRYESKDGGETIVQTFNVMFMEIGDQDVIETDVTTRRSYSPCLCVVFNIFMVLIIVASFVFGAFYGLIPLGICAGLNFLIKKGYDRADFKLAKQAFFTLVKKPLVTGGQPTATSGGARTINCPYCGGKITLDDGGA